MVDYIISINIKELNLSFIKYSSIFSIFKIHTHTHTYRETFVWWSGQPHQQSNKHHYVQHTIELRKKNEWKVIIRYLKFKTQTIEERDWENLKCCRRCLNFSLSIKSNLDFYCCYCFLTLISHSLFFFSSINFLFKVILQFEIPIFVVAFVFKNWKNKFKYRADTCAWV